MAKFSALIAATTLALSASALPAEMKPRVCGQVDAPDMLISVQKFPDSTWHGSPNTHFAATQTFVNGALEESYAQVVAFNGPIGAYGCQIGITFPDDIAAFYAATGLDGSTNPPVLDVRRVSFPVSESEAYSELERGALIGTATVRPGRQIINTVTCPTAADGGMAFVFEIPEWVKHSTAAYWNNQIKFNDLATSIGVYVNYNC